MTGTMMGTGKELDIWSVEKFSVGLRDGRRTRELRVSEARRSDSLKRS
jgi:hypothetical protein